MVLPFPLLQEQQSAADMDSIHHLRLLLGVASSLFSHAQLLIKKLSSEIDEEETLYIVLQRASASLLIQPPTPASLSELEGMATTLCAFCGDMKYLENEEMVAFLHALPAFFSVPVVAPALFRLVAKLAHAVATLPALFFRLFRATFALAVASSVSLHPRRSLVLPTHPTHSTHSTHPTYSTHPTHSTYSTHSTHPTHPTHSTHPTHPTHPTQMTTPQRKRERRAARWRRSPRRDRVSARRGTPSFSVDAPPLSDP